jgi:hypothetical protein
MDHVYFKQLFRKFSGFIYQYVGLIPEGEDPRDFLSNEFVSLTGKNGLEISLSQLSNGSFVIYSNENLESNTFIKVHDLSYQPELETLPDPEPEIVTESETPAESDQEE